MSVFKIENLSFSYDGGKTMVMENINYEFEKGKTYAIVGRSGTGKTTLLSLMSGLDNPTSGKIIYEGKDISKIDEDTYRSKHVGVVFQSFNLLPHLSALENVELSMDVSKTKIENKKQTAINLLEQVGLDLDKANRRILKLSGGEQQRVAIARAISYNPEVVLADEPTGNLDTRTEKQIIEVLSSLAHDKNKCVIIVTHSKVVAESVDVVYDLAKDKKSNKKEEKVKSNKNS